MNDRIYENYVYQVVKEGNLTKAAEKIGISQPALSSGITTLEKRLGFPVFNRYRNPITLTEEGAIYYDYLNRKNALTSDFHNRLEARQGNRDSHATIGSSVVYSESIVAQAVYKLLKKHPEYSVSIVTDSISGLVESAKNGELDCFISTSDKLSNEFVKKEIKHEKIYLCVPKENPINEQMKKFADMDIPFSDFSLLQEEPFILLEKNQPIQLLVDSFLSDTGIQLKRCVTVNQVSVAVNLSVLGLGCCFASEDALFNSSIWEKVNVYSLPEFVSDRSIYVVYHHDFYRSKACMDLIDLILER